MATITSGETNNMITFESATKYLDAKTFVEMAMGGEIEEPESFTDVIKFIAKIGGVKIIEKQNTPDSASSDVAASIKARLKLPAGDRFQGWRYKSDVLNQLKRRKFYVDLCASSGLSVVELFESAIRFLGGEIEISKDDKQIRLVTNPKPIKVPYFTIDCPDMDF